MAKVFHQELAKQLLSLEEPYSVHYTYKPRVILENSNYKLRWDRTVLVDTPVPLNWPDVTLIDKTTNNIASPLNHNVQDTNAEKQCKYQDLTLLEKCARRRFRGQAVNTI